MPWRRIAFPRPISKICASEAQQAAEKAIKALLITHGIEFPYVHDLNRLLALLEEAGEKIPETIRKAESLTTYAITTRYPSAGNPIYLQEYREAIEIAEAVFQWAEERL